uniref:Alternative protein PCTP n=1 Tax=Homo sapiens TaxID=9606 RepID=L8EA98_HUMAN|nr:alternative protein PCTP [Homo sapiens]
MSLEVPPGSATWKCLWKSTHHCSAFPCCFCLQRPTHYHILSKHVCLTSSSLVCFLSRSPHPGLGCLLLQFNMGQTRETFACLLLGGEVFSREHDHSIVQFYGDGWAEGHNKI